MSINYAYSNGRLASITNNSAVYGFTYNTYGAVERIKAVGGVSGALGGAGKGTKHIKNLGIKTITRPFEELKHKGLKAGLKEAGKAFAYYSKNTKSYYKGFIKGVPNDVFSAITTTIVSSDYMKSQYRKFFRGTA